MSDFKLSKWGFAPNISQVVFKNAKGTRILINEENICDALVEDATAQGFGHCFIEKKNVELKKKQSASQYTPVTSTLNVVPTGEQDSLPVVENKRADSLPVEKKKRGPKSKSKE